MICCRCDGSAGGGAGGGVRASASPDADQHFQHGGRRHPAATQLLQRRPGGADQGRTAVAEGRAAAATAGATGSTPPAAATAAASGVAQSHPVRPQTAVVHRHVQQLDKLPSVEGPVYKISYDNLTIILR